MRYKNVSQHVERAFQEGLYLFKEFKTMTVKLLL
jgi:hypothetical protein